MNSEQESANVIDRLLDLAPPEMDEAAIQRIWQRISEAIPELQDQDAPTPPASSSSARDKES